LDRRLSACREGNEIPYRSETRAATNKKVGGGFLWPVWDRTGVGYRPEGNTFSGLSHAFRTVTSLMQEGAGAGRE